MAKDTKDGNNLNEKSYVNKKLLQCYLIISMVLLAAYIMELVKGNRTAGYVFVFFDYSYCAGYYGSIRI